MNGLEHVGDAAALYALGALDEVERKAIDRHAATCPECARLIGDAEARVATIAACEVQHAPPAQLERRVLAVAGSQPQRRTNSSRLLVAAMAAALIVGLLPSAYFWQQSQTMHAAMIAQADAIDRVASMPHRSAAFHQMSDGSAASVMYAPDGSWYVVLVRGASRALSVAWMHDGQRTMLGTATPHGDVALLYLPKSHRMDQLALLDGDRVVGEAQLAY